MSFCLVKTRDINGKGSTVIEKDSALGVNCKIRTGLIAGNDRKSHVRNSKCHFISRNGGVCKRTLAIEDDNDFVFVQTIHDV